MSATQASPRNFRPLRRVELHKLVAAGAFEDERIELLDGVLVPMSPIGPPHCSAVDVLNEILVVALQGRARVRVQNSFAASDISEPQPDLLVVPRGDYRGDHPAEAHLAIEVAESSLAQDRGRKLGMYAESGIPEYWIVDLAARRIEVYREPRGGTYAWTRCFSSGETLPLFAFSDVVVPVADVFG